MVGNALAEQEQVDPLPSWTEGPEKKSIIDFIHEAGRGGGQHETGLKKRVFPFEMQASASTTGSFASPLNRSNQACSETPASE
jgi:hypothetical protein